jgi:hypothetical protein
MTEVISVRPQVLVTITVGQQPAVRKFATVEDMLTTIGRSGDLAYCYNQRDVFYKWSMDQRTWIVANI